MLPLDSHSPDFCLVNVKHVFRSYHNFFAVIDFEATCTDKNEFPRSETEIIEFACILIDSKLNVVTEFNEYIRPKIHPQLTDFCKKLTTISQQQVDSAPPFPEVLDQFSKAIIEKYKPLFASWGNYDKNQLMQDCR